MSIYLNTWRCATLAIGICDRCHRKVPHAELHADTDRPGLMVCNEPGCNDRYDPYKLPTRKTEDITIRKPRPEDPINIEEVPEPDLGLPLV